jgi:hypothetical protein
MADYGLGRSLGRECLFHMKDLCKQEYDAMQFRCCYITLLLNTVTTQLITTEGSFCHHDVYELPIRSGLNRVSIQFLAYGTTKVLSSARSKKDCLSHLISRYLNASSIDLFHSPCLLFQCLHTSPFQVKLHHNNCLQKKMLIFFSYERRNMLPRGV